MKYRVQNIVNNEYLDDDVIFLLPNGEVGWFIRDGSYPHYRKFGHQEDFKVIDEDCERLQKQLEIAFAGLQYYANEDIYIERHQVVNGNNEWTSEVMLDNGVKASYFLKKIEELSND